MSKIRNIPLKAPLNVNKENLWKLTDFLKFIAKMGVGEETSISKDAGNYFFSDVSLSKIQISLFRTNVKYRHIERKEDCPDGRRSQKDDSHTVFRWTCCTYLEQSTYHSQQRGKIFFFSSNQSSPTAKQYRTVVFSRHLFFFFALKRPVNPIEFLGNHLIKVANEPPSPEETKSISSASTPTPMD